MKISLEKWARVVIKGVRKEEIKIARECMSVHTMWKTL